MSCCCSTGSPALSGPPDRLHPFGYGRELYFWSFVVALLIFALGPASPSMRVSSACCSPSHRAARSSSFSVLGVSLAFEGGSWWVGMRAFRAAKRSLGWWQAFRRSKDPPAFIVVFEDSAAILGIVVAAAGTAAAMLTGDTRWDGVASLAIAVTAGGRRGVAGAGIQGSSSSASAPTLA